MSGAKKISAVQLRVAEARQRDVGKSRARFDRSLFDEAGIAPGDAVEIIGKRTTVATALPSDPEDETLSILRVDGQMRKNAGVAVNEFATVRKAASKSAKSVFLTASLTKVPRNRDFAEFVRNRLKGSVAMAGDEVSVIILGNPIAFKVQRTKPKGCVRVDQSTVVSILAETFVPKKGGYVVTYEQIGGLLEEIRRLREIIELPLRRPEVFQKLGIDPPNGILLHGPPGCGKTLLARALANECDASFYSLNGPEIMNKYYGETESKLRELFKEARENSPAIIFIDEIDALAPKREETFGDVEKRVVAQLLALMDGVAERGDVVVIGATNRPDTIDWALRRPGRFDREVQIGVPNSEARFDILQIHTRGMPLSNEIDLKEMALELHGYTGADIRALCREAALKALRRYLPDIDEEGDVLGPYTLDKMRVTESDFRDARKEIVPTALREFYSETPKVKWEDVCGLPDLKKELAQNVIWAIRNPQGFSKVGMSAPKGMLLYGPPGCGKTLLAWALATESGANLIPIKGPEILSKWLGESEKAIREIFRKAKSSAPCIVLFDEIDSLAPVRGSSSQSADSKILSQLLTEIDNSGSAAEVFVLGTTNRPDLVDVSLLRPGRLELLRYVPPPDEKGRLEILKIYTCKTPLDASVDLEDLAARLKGYTGADLQAVCREAATEAMCRDSNSPLVRGEDFDIALSKVRPAITSNVESWFTNLEKRMKGTEKPAGFIG